MDWIRKLSSQLVALDGHNQVIAYYEGDDPHAFLDEILRSRHLETDRITIHHVCPYVWTDPDKWYAENEPLISRTLSRPPTKTRPADGTHA